ncbi:hypothetical protein [Rhodoferax lacus]|uniref:hypothetical protein n=1 Tax=Rhodoferax lacus TaxID=2184758 RepID=UPI001314520F|nr:hypothetical protein [Rhodoferax lacus]
MALTVKIQSASTAHGVCLVQTTANGPRKTVFIEDEAAAHWLQQQFALKGMEVEIRFL